MKKKHLICLLLIALIAISAGCSRPENKTDLIVPERISAAPEPQLSESQRLLAQMSLDEKIGQLLVVGFPQGTSEEQLREYIDTYKVSGFILFKRNYKSFDELYKLCSTLKGWNSANPVPLFLSVDEEGGTVSRLPAGGTHFPDAQLIGRLNDPGINYEVGRTIGKELRSAGINLDFAPVLDVLSNKNSRLLIKRAYSSSPEVVKLYGSEFIEGLQSEGVISAPKHFPGHGATSIDSHGKLPVIGIDKKTLESRELVPFKYCTTSGLDAVMVGHLAFPKIDPSGLPATMSEVFLKNILRDEMGFKGIAITDEIEMYGFTGSKETLEASVVTAFNAGVDIFIVGHTRSIQLKVFKALKEGVENGSIDKKRLDESVLRIIEVKQKYKLPNKMDMEMTEAKKVFGSKENKAVLEKVKTLIKKKR